MPSRCFLAIDLSEPTRRLLSRVDDVLLAETPAWVGEKWVAPSLRHVTVTFIGAIPDDALPVAVTALGAALEAHPPFELRMHEVQAIPSTRRASMLWVGFERSEPATLLSTVCGQALASVGIAEAGHAGLYRPHVTLVRTRHPRSVSIESLRRATSLLSSGKEADRGVSVRSVSVLSSTLSKAGPRYEVLAVVPLMSGSRAD